MERREFIAAGLTAGAALAASAASAQTPAAAPAPKFKMKYAPHPGMFRRAAGRTVVDEIKFMADQGFSALEDNGMPGRPVEEQEAMAQAMAQHGIEMGVFVAEADFDNVTFVSNDPAVRERLVNKLKAAVEVAKRVNAKWTTVVLGRFDPKLEWDYQTAYAVDNLKFCAEVCEPHGLTMVLEPLNAFSDHPGLFLTGVPQAYQICKAVGSPSCKILDDLYHQQITEGNLIPNMERAWDEIAYIQVGDNPGRKEPGTGEINYKNVFKWLHAKGYTGVIGMEHGVAGSGEEGIWACIEAYRQCDAF